MELILSSIRKNNMRKPVFLVYKEKNWLKQGRLPASSFTVWRISNSHTRRPPATPSRGNSHFPKLMTLTVIL